MSRQRHKTLWHPIEYVTEPKDLQMVRVLRNHWWLTDDRGWIAIHDLTAPQCNPDRRITELLLNKKIIPGATGLRQIPLAFTPERVEDW